MSGLTLEQYCRRNIFEPLMMQFLPFVDKEAVGLLGDFERAVYST